MTTTPSSGDLNQNASGAKRAARRGPVFITDRGEPSHVLMPIEDYRKLAGKQPNIVAQLAMPAASAIAFAPPRLSAGIQRTARRR